MTLQTFIGLSCKFRIDIDASIVARVLRSPWDYREGTFPATPRDAGIKPRTRIEGNGTVARTDAIERFAPDETLEELVAAIERDILADRPVAALNRLHTYCAMVGTRCP